MDYTKKRIGLVFCCPTSYPDGQTQRQGEKSSHERTLFKYADDGAHFQTVSPERHSLHLFVHIEIMV